MDGGRVRVGIAGTSWWAEAMYLPALAQHPLAEVRAIAGGSRPEHAREVAGRWGIPRVHASAAELIADGELDALLVLTPNASHVEVALAAVERGLHVLCEKPLGRDAREVRRLAEAAAARGVRTMVPFTYRWMPVNRHVHDLVASGWIGRPHHLDLRYYTGYGLSGDYRWRFDVGEAGAGVLGDLGSHWIDMARWHFGEIRAVSALLARVVPRGPRPDGRPYEAADDVAHLLLEFESGATGSIHVTAVAFEPGDFGQRHQMDFHGSGGTLRSDCDWETLQRIEGQRVGDDAPHEIAVPDALWGGARRARVPDTYRDVFRTQESMARAFVSSIARGTPVGPDFADGLAVQRVIAAADRSARQGRRVEVAEIVAEGG